MIVAGIRCDFYTKFVTVFPPFFITKVKIIIRLSYRILKAAVLIDFNFISVTDIIPAKR